MLNKMVTTNVILPIIKYPAKKSKINNVHNIAIANGLFSFFIIIYFLKPPWTLTQEDASLLRYCLGLYGYVYVWLHVHFLLLAFFLTSTLISYLRERFLNFIYISF